MNKIQASYLFAAILSFLAVIAMDFFAVTDGKNAPGLSAVAGFFALTGTFWIYRFAKGRRTL